MECRYDTPSLKSLVLNTGRQCINQRGKESRLWGKGSWRENKVSVIIEGVKECEASGCSGDDLNVQYYSSKQLFDWNID